MLRISLLFITLLLSHGGVAAPPAIPECAVFHPNRHHDSSWRCKLADASWQAISTGAVKFRPIHIEPNITPAHGKIKNILVLSSKLSSAYDESSLTLFQSLYGKADHYRFTLFNYAQNCSTTPSSMRCPNADAALHKAMLDHFDLVVSMGSDTTIYLANHANFNTLPIVSACAKDPRHLGLLDQLDPQRPQHIAYTSLDIDPTLQIDYLQSLFLQKLKHIILLVDTDNISSIKTQAEPLEKTIQRQHSNLSVTRLNIQLQGHYKKLIQTHQLEHYLNETLYRKLDHYRTQYAARTQKIGLSPQTHSPDTLFLITGSTEIFNHIDAINQHAGHIPVLSVTPSFITAGRHSAFMALGVSFTRNARKAADYIYQILESGVSPSALPLGQISSPDIAINFRLLPTGFKVPYAFFENASYIFDLNGKAVRCDGKNVFPPEESCRSTVFSG